MKIVRAAITALLMLMLTAALPLTVSADFAENGKITVVIDPGHGGYDGGTDVGTLTEKEYDLLIANAIRDELLADGHFDVYLTREDDIFLSFLERVLVARNVNADLMLSVHCNSNPDPGPNGLMAYVSVVDECDASVLGNSILDCMSETAGMKRGRCEYREDTGDSLGVYYWNAEKHWDMPGASSLKKKSDYYSINTWSSKFGIHSVLVEHGYLSNSGDLSILDDTEKRTALAKAEADAVIAYYTGHEHSWSDLTVDYPSNCVMNGTESYKCRICGAKYSIRTLPDNPDGHYWRQSESVRATCTEDGYIGYVCQISYNLSQKGYGCDEHTYREVIPATGHNYVPVDGTYIMRCEYCGDEYSTEPEYTEPEPDPVPDTPDEGTVSGIQEQNIEEQTTDVPDTDSEPDTVITENTTGTDPEPAENTETRENETKSTYVPTVDNSPLEDYFRERELKEILSNPLMSAGITVALALLVAIPVIMIITGSKRRRR